MSGSTPGFTLPQLTASDGVAPDKLYPIDVKRALDKVRQPFNVNALGLAAAVAALGDTTYMNESRELNRAGLAAMAAGLERLGLAYIPSVGNFIAFEPGRDPASVYQALLREGVIVRPIGEYGLAGHLRVTVGLPAETERFLSALERVLR